MRVFWAYVLICTAAFAQSPPDSKPAPPSLANLGLAYPLSSDWILATTLMRSKAEAENSSGNSIVLGAVYLPQKKNLSSANPIFLLIALHRAHPDCAEFLDAMHQQLEKQDKTQIKNEKQMFSAAGREFYRTDFEQKAVLGHRSLICTPVKDYVVVWNASAADEKGLEAIVATLDSIKSTEAAQPPQQPQPSEADDTKTPESASDSPKLARPARVRVSSGVVSGLLIKKVAPVYPPEARSAYIQGTVILKAEISKEGDVANLELLSGPIELVGSAVDAVRRWKYRPYLFNGEPIIVDTQIQVNFALAGR